MSRIHVLGAAGSGTTSLGVAVAAGLGVPHFDTDDFFWLSTDPPFTAKRPAGERVALLSERLAPRPNWVLSGSARGWGEPLESLYDLVVFLVLDPAVRLERLRRRERAQHGSRIEAGGDMAEIHAAFLGWAGTYDTAGEGQRSRAAHEAWLATRRIPVLRLDSAEPLPALVGTALEWVRATSGR